MSGGFPPAMDGAPQGADPRVVPSRRVVADPELLRDRDAIVRAPPPLGRQGSFAALWGAPGDLTGWRIGGTIGRIGEPLAASRCGARSAGLCAGGLGRAKPSPTRG
eukprot:4169448-Prymnesium_polylepis.2